MKRILAGALVVAGFSGHAFAADLPARTYTKAPPIVAAYDWSGFYIGANGGYGWGNNENADIQPGGGFWTAAPGREVRTFTPEGAIYGGQIGYNWQFGNWVLGLEGQYDGAGLRETDTTPSYSRTSKIDSIVTGTVRLGYAFNNWLPYIKGGYAGASLKGANGLYGTFAMFPGVYEAAVLDHSQWRNGFVIGGGLEYAFARNWTIGVEYNYLDLGSQSWSGTTFEYGVDLLGPYSDSRFEHFSDKLTISTVTARLNYKFDSGR